MIYVSKVIVIISYLNVKRSCKRYDLITGAGSDFSLLNGDSILVDFPSANTISINIMIKSCSGGLGMLCSKQRVDTTSIKKERHSNRNLECNLLIL